MIKKIFIFAAAIISTFTISAFADGTGLYGYTFTNLNNYQYLNGSVILSDVPFIEEDELSNYYSDIEVSAEAREYLARMTHAEYENGTDIDKELTVEVTLNRVKHSGFKNSVIDVLFEAGQYSTKNRIKNPKTPPTQADYDAVDYVLEHGLTRIPEVLANQGLDHDATKCVYFDTGKKNGKANFKYNGHWFGFDFKG